VLESLGGLRAAGAGSRGGIVPGRVGQEVALPRAHLVEVPRVEFGEAHKRVRLQRGAVGVSCWVRCGRLPLLHEELAAEEFQLRVGAARRRRRVGLAEQVLGGNWERGGPIRAKGEKHRMRESVQGEVGPVHGRRPRPGPREGQSSARIHAGEGSMIGGVAVYLRRLKGGWRPGGGRVHLRRGAHYPKAGQAACVRKEEI